MEGNDEKLFVLLCCGGDLCVLCSFAEKKIREVLTGSGGRTKMGERYFCSGVLISARATTRRSRLNTFALIVPQKERFAFLTSPISEHDCSPHYPDVVPRPHHSQFSNSESQFLKRASISFPALVSPSN